MAILKTNRIHAMAKIAATNILVWSFTNGLVACLVTIAEVAQISTRNRKKNSYKNFSTTINLCKVITKIGWNDESKLPIKNCILQ